LLPVDMSKAVTDFSVKLITVVEAASEGIVTFLRSGKIEEWVQETNKWRNLARNDINNFLQLESVTQFFKVSRPVINEFSMFFITWIGPWILLLFWISSIGLVRFSKYLSKRLEKPETPLINRAIAILANFWSKYADLYHDHKVFGLENIPANGPAILVWYHGPIPVDYISLVAKLYLRDGRLVNSVVDKTFQNMPLWEEAQRHFKMTSNGKGYCVDLLENGELLGVAVGGAREACFDNDYSADWGSRNGFAKVALFTGVPIIPIFTENIREAYSTLSIGRDVWKHLYEKTKLPMVPTYGGFPVPLRTHIGEPIRVVKNETDDQLARRVNETMQGMIRMYQNREDGVTDLLLDRVYQQYSLEDKMV